METPKASPVNERLSESIRYFTVATAKVLKKVPEIRVDLPKVFQDFCYLWFFPNGGSAGEKAFIKNNKQRLIVNGFDGQRITDELTRIFSEELHLNRCCTDVWMLCRLLSDKFVNFTASELIDEDSIDDEYLSFVCDRFIQWVYEEPLKIYCASHLFNFDSKLYKVNVAGFDILQFTQFDIDRLFRDPYTAQINHQPGVGNFFIVQEIIDESIHLRNFQPTVANALTEANDFITFLSYFKNGVVYRDYSMLFFRPTWINDFFPIGPLGSSHGIPYARGEKPYRLEKSEIGKLERWRSVFTESGVSESLETNRNNLNKQLRVAMEFFESNREQKSEEQRLIHLMVALESLFSPSDQKELSYRIRQYASQLVGKTSLDRIRINSIIKNMYDIRSKFVHGSLDVDKYYEGSLIKVENNIELMDITRRCILAFLTLAARGKANLNDGNKPNSVHSQLELSSFDSRIRNSMQRESDVERFIKEFSSQQKK